MAPVQPVQPEQRDSRAFVLIAIGMGLAAVLLIEVVRPGQDNSQLDYIVVGLIAAAFAAAGLSTSRQNAAGIQQASAQIVELHVMMNHELADTKKDIAMLAHARGVSDEHSRAAAESDRDSVIHSQGVADGVAQAAAEAPKVDG